MSRACQASAFTLTWNLKVGKVWDLGFRVEGPKPLKLVQKTMIILHTGGFQEALKVWESRTLCSGF